MTTKIKAPELIFIDQMETVQEKLRSLGNGFNVLLSFAKEKPNETRELLENIKKLANEHCNSDKVLDWLYSEQNSDLKEILIKFIQASKDTALMIAERFKVSIPIDNSAKIIDNDEDGFVVTKNDLENAIAFFSLDECNSIFQLPYFQSLNLSDEDVRTVHEIQTQAQQNLLAKTAKLIESVTSSHEAEVLDQNDLHKLTTKLADADLTEINEFIQCYEQHMATMKRLERYDDMFISFVDDLKRKCQNALIAETALDGLSTLNEIAKKRKELVSITNNYNEALMPLRQKVPAPESDSQSSLKL